MSYLLVVFVIELIFCSFEYVNAKAVFANPSFLSMSVVTVSTGLGIIGNTYWNVSISPAIIPVVLCGFVSMYFSDSLAKKTTKKSHYSKNVQIHDIEVNERRINIVLAIVVFCTVLYAIDVLRSGASMGYGGLSAIYAVKRDRSGTSIIIRQGIKIVMAAMFVHTFIFTNNVIILRKRGLKNYKHIIPAICAVVCCIFTSVRTEIFRVLTALIVCLCVLIFQKRNWKMAGLRRFVKKILPYVLIGVVLLVGVRFIVKGTENATSNTYGVFMYIAYYLGTPIIVLGSKLNDGLLKYRGSLFGETTFNQLYGFLQEHGLFNGVSLQDGSKNVWIDQRNRITANVDTIFGPPSIDFGILGMTIYIFILFYFLNKYYYKYIYKSDSTKKRDVCLITYSFLAAIPSMAFYTNYFNQYLTVYFVLTLILIKIIEMYYGMIKSPFRRSNSSYFKRVSKSPLMSPNVKKVKNGL